MITPCLNRAAPFQARALRSLGGSMLLVGALSGAGAAHADQNIMAADNGTIRCEASAKDLTRISLKDDQFASVSKMQAENPAEDFQVVNEPVRGDIYLSVPSGYPKPNLSFFGTTKKGFVYKFLCAVGGAEPRQVFVANVDGEEARSASDVIPSGLAPGESAARLISAMYEQRPVEGYEVSWRSRMPVTTGSLKVQLVGEYVGGEVTGKILKITNDAAAPAVLSEDQVGPSDAVGVSITNAKLAPGQVTMAYVVVRSTAQGDQ